METIRRRAPDFWLFAAVLALMGLGLVMVYSASAIVALDAYGDSAFFLKRQLLWTVVGLGAMGITGTTRYTRLRPLTPLLLLLVTVALCLVLVPGVGRVAGGARRWLTLGPLNLQPAEAAKLVLVLYLAKVLAARPGPGSSAHAGGRQWAGPVLLAATWCGLVLVQPDMGSALMLAAIGGGMAFLAGTGLLRLAAAAVLALPVVGAAALLEPYRVRRLLAFLDPWADPRGSGFHIIQSLLALGSGGVLGLGLGESRQKFFYLPERHTDFIFAIVGEELGLVGTVAVLALFALVAARGFGIARRAPDRYAALLAGGITAAVTGQAVLNIGVATGVLPVTGVPLPFMSFGGSSLLFTCAGVGILLNISRYAARRPGEAPAGAAAGGRAAGGGRA
ncbi:MAG: putative lipid II flippase FtsW, partial [Armatimonadota bacterium]|nr:putative lipid II flippase FtsW [Armatimonadota bacterium]